VARRASRDIICAECPDIYSEYEIVATRGDESRPLVEVLGRTEPSSSARVVGGSGRSLRRLLGRESQLDPTDPVTLGMQREKLSNLSRLKDWTFTCPRGHSVDGNRGYQVPLAVVGASGSSKSHFLPGMVWETSLMRALSPLGVTLRPGQFTSSQLNYHVRQLYEEKKILPPTPPDAVAGPFGYRLSVRDQGEDARYSLLLFDIGGEALSSIVRIGEQARFVLLAQGIIVLIDPHGAVSTLFDSPQVDGVGNAQRERLIAAARIREGIGLIADVLEELWDVPMTHIPVPVCFVVAKADSVSWSYSWQAETSKVMEGTREGRDLRGLLLESSDRVKSEFADFGGELIVEEVEERFSPSRIRFAAASVTSEMPQADGWTNPVPIGISLTLLHVLDMLEKIHFNPGGTDKQAHDRSAGFK
jgi:hypothetical protein